MGSKRLYQWQLFYAQKIRNLLRTQKFGIVQLPTGSGKTVIVLSAIRPLVKREKYSVVFLSPNFRAAKDPENPWRRDQSPKRFAGLRLVQKRTFYSSHTLFLNDGLVINDYSYNWPYDYIRLIRRRPRKLESPAGRSNHWIIVVDEAHRAKRIIKALRNIGLSRVPVSGDFKIVFVSATPVNPVRLEEFGRDEDFERRLTRVAVRGYMDLYEAALVVSPGRHKAIAEFEKIRNINRTDLEKAGTIKKSDIEKTDAINKKEYALNKLQEIAEKWIKPVPWGKEAEKHFYSTYWQRDRYNINLFQALKNKKIPPRLSRDINLLVDFEQELYRKFGRSNSIRRLSIRKFIDLSIVERLAVGGATREPHSFEKGRKHNKPEGLKALTSVERLFKLGLCRGPEPALNYKPDNLISFLKRYFEKEGQRSTRSGKVLIFCEYRYTVYWLSQHLERRVSEWLPERFKNAEPSECSYFGPAGTKRYVWDTESLKHPKKHKRGWGTANEKKLLNDYNKTKSQDLGYRGLVLVTSDRNSESIDLHENSEVVIHYDLDWSPMVMLQRVGRLWRHERFKSRKIREGRIPSFPKVFHLKYPCSVDYEIFVRLLKRWENLKTLNFKFDYLGFRDAVGEDLEEYLNRT